MSSKTFSPQVFGRYVLTSLLAEGGMAEVYLATVRVAEGLTKRVVIKKIRKEFAAEPEFTRMFVDEAKIALSLNHANIVQVFDFGQVRDVFYLAMELVEGIDLMRLLSSLRARGERFPPVIAAYIAHQVASGLAYAHRKKDDYGTPLDIVHRDVSPHNVMVSFEGQVKILDFGIARTKAHAMGLDDGTDAHRKRAEAETIKGKVAYMSPEQAHGRPVDARSDIYSLGAVLHELLSGQLLFRHRDRMEALELVRSQPVPPIAELAPDLPQELEAITNQALARDPAQRFQTARALQAALTDFLHHSDPVVDDEVLSDFVSRYHQAPVLARVGTSSWEQHATRELGDTEASGIRVRTVRESQRIILVYLALEPRRLLPSDPVPDAGDFLNVAKDIAFKRDAHVVRVDERSVVLAFGTLLRAADDTHRALRAALALREDAGEHAHGIAVGAVVAGANAVVQRSVEGPPEVEINPRVLAQIDRMARRTMEGPVLVSGELVERLSDLWRFGATTFIEPDPGTGSPGDPNLEQAAPVLGPAVSADGRGPQVPGGRRLLYGREIELKTLRDGFSEAIRSRQSRAALVLGAPGLGRRALVDRFVSSLPRTSCYVLRAAGSWSRRNVPLGVFVDLLGRFFGDGPSGVTRETLISQLRDHEVPEPETAADALSSALGLADAPEGGVDPLERRDRLWRLIRRLLRALAQRRPVTLVVENVHFLDEQSLLLLRQWIQGRAPLPVLVVLTGRPTPRVERLREVGPLAVVQLRELDPQTRRELILHRFEDPQSATELAEAVVATAGGNPLFIEETLTALLQQGVVGWNASGRQLVVRQRGVRIALPPSVQGALRARVEQLPPSMQEVMSGAAVLGRMFRSDELQAVLERSVERDLDALVSRNLLERENPGAPGAEDFRFETVSLHDVCKAHPAPALRERLHSRAAEIKQARADYTPGRDDGPIADHLVAAGRPREAIDPALRAARENREVAGNVAAYYYLSQALKAMEADDGRRFGALLQRETVLHAWGRRRAQSADIRQLIETAEASGDTRREVTAYLRLLRFYIEIDRIHAAQRLLPRLRDRLEQLGQPAPFRATLLELESDLAHAQRRYAEAEAIAIDALEVGDSEYRDDGQQAHILISVGRARFAMGRNDDARRSFEEALELARGQSDRRLEATVLNNLGEVAGRSARYQEAADLFRAALAIDRDLGDRFATGIKLANLGIVYVVLGLYAKAERYLRKALELHEASGHDSNINDAIVSLGEVVGELGHLDAARTFLDEAVEVARRRGDERTELRARVRLAQALLHHGDDPAHREEARAIAQEVADRGREGRYRTATCRALHVLAMLAAHGGQSEQAIALEREAVELFRAGAAPLDGVRSIHHLGKLLIADGDEASGRAHLEEAAHAVQDRANQLRDEEFRMGYLEQPSVATILRDGGVECTVAPPDDAG